MLLIISPTRFNKDYILKLNLQAPETPSLESRVQYSDSFHLHFGERPSFNYEDGIIQRYLATKPKTTAELELTQKALKFFFGFDVSLKYPLMLMIINPEDLTKEEFKQFKITDDDKKAGNKVFSYLNRVVGEDWGAKGNLNEPERTLPALLAMELDDLVARVLFLQALLQGDKWKKHLRLLLTSQHALLARTLKLDELTANNPHPRAAYPVLLSTSAEALDRRKQGLDNAQPALPAEWLKSLNFLMPNEETVKQNNFLMHYLEWPQDYIYHKALLSSTKNIQTTLAQLLEQYGCNLPEEATLPTTPYEQAQFETFLNNDASFKTSYFRALANMKQDKNTIYQKIRRVKKAVADSEDEG